MTMKYGTEGTLGDCLGCLLDMVESKCWKLVKALLNVEIATYSALGLYLKLTGQH